MYLIQLVLIFIVSSDYLTFKDIQDKRNVDGKFNTHFSFCVFFHYGIKWVKYVKRFRLKVFLYN